MYILFFTLMTTDIQSLYRECLHIEAVKGLLRHWEVCYEIEETEDVFNSGMFIYDFLLISR